MLIVGKRTETNCALAAAFTGLGERAQVAERAALSHFRHGDVAIARLDVLPTLDGIEPGIWRLPRLEQLGVEVVNGPRALLAAHDKLATTRVLGLAGVAHPRTAHVRDGEGPPFPPPYVVKPRFGS